MEGEPSPRIVTLNDAREVVVGRDASAGIRLAHDAVSRHHLRLFERDGRWFVEDLGSRHGTMVDGVLLAPRRPVPVGRSAVILVRPFALRVESNAAVEADADGNGSTSISTNSQHDPESVVRALEVAELGELNSRRLALLLEAAEAIHSARDERSVAEAATAALITGTGFARALMLRWTGDIETLETLAVRVGTDVDAVPSARVSRTLLRAAGDGLPVMLEDQAPLREAESIIGSGVAAALCVPVTVPPLVEAFLYLDSQRRSARPNPDAATFCHLVAKLCGLAIANIRRVAAEARQRELEQQLGSARLAQESLLPSERGVIGECRWRLFSRPGQVVAGDIAGVHQHADAVTFFIGDVRGKGVDAAMVMTMVASHLAACLSEGMPIDAAVTRTGAFIHAHRRDEADFVSLLVVQFDARAGRVRTVDAGHGLALVVGVDGAVTLESEGGPVLGIAPDIEYGLSERALVAGERLVLFTDGLVEQHSADGGPMLGTEPVSISVIAAGTPDMVVERLRTMLCTHAGGEIFADDVTILCIDPAAPRVVFDDKPDA